MTTNIEPLADTVAVAAARLNICVAEFYKQISAGRIKVRKLGRRTLVERTEQELWLTSLPLKGVAA